MRIQNCNSFEEQMITNRHRDALRWIDDAAQKIISWRAHASITGTLSPQPAQSLLQTIRSVILSNFKTDAPADVDAISANFVQLANAMRRHGNLVYIKCEITMCLPDELMYVHRQARAISFGADEVFVCPIWFGRSALRQISTVIHERAHQSLRVADRAYEHRHQYTTMTSTDAMNNAESYAVAARQIFHNGNHGPGQIPD